MKDLTIIYYTANVVPGSFGKKVIEQLLKVVGNLPIISVSQKPVDLGYNICVGDIGRSHLNIYRQALIGTKAAQTKYVAFCEDDVLYSPDHFSCHVPSPGTFAYNINYWCMYTWVHPPIFSYKDRRNMYGLICEKDLFIEAMEERFRKWPDDAKIQLGHWAEPGKYEGRGHLDVTPRKSEKFMSKIPNIAFSHPSALSYLGLGKRKRIGITPKTELDYWGKAEDILKIYN